MLRACDADLHLMIITIPGKRLASESEIPSRNTVESIADNDLLGISARMLSAHASYRTNIKYIIYAT